MAGPVAACAGRDESLTAVKLAEDRDALVLRGLELEGQADQLVLDTGAVAISARGIATALSDGGSVRAGDGLER